MLNEVNHNAECTQDLYLITTYNPGFIPDEGNCLKQLGSAQEISSYKNCGREMSNFWLQMTT